MLTPARANAQHEHHAGSAPRGWSVDLTGQAFLTLNLQHRKFSDFHQLESQNWAMAMARHTSDRWTVSFHAMASAEPFTLRRLGSAQVFQAGESLDGLPLRDYQHPHDLLMGFGARVEHKVGASARVYIEGGPVGSPALGPPAFMHRASSMRHPTAPLSHHMLDSSHITHTVVTTGVAAGRWVIEASGFHGTEPDEDRLRTELGAINSWAARLAHSADSWRAQASIARVRNPDPLEPGDVTRVTTSLESRPASGRSWTFAVGRNAAADHAEWGLLAEVDMPFGPRWAGYGRAEIVDRFILVDFPATAAAGRERHLLSRIGALTLGADRTVWTAGAHALAVGADLTLHHTPRNLRDSYGWPVSVHLFVRWALTGGMR